MKFLARWASAGGQVRRSQHPAEAGFLEPVLQQKPAGQFALVARRMVQAPELRVLVVLTLEESVSRVLGIAPDVLAAVELIDVVGDYRVRSNLVDGGDTIGALRGTVSVGAPGDEALVTKGKVHLGIVPREIIDVPDIPEEFRAYQCGFHVSLLSEGLTALLPGAGKRLD